MNAVPLLIGILCVFLGEPAGVSLRGTVLDAAGKPLGGARVGIATAAPRVGQALFCPSCYRDCTKWTRGDAEGKFEIKGLDTTLKFTVLASTPTKLTHHTKLVDPLLGDIKIVLQALPAELPRERSVVAQIVDDRGQAIAGALISPFGGKNAEQRWWGPVKGVGPTVSDDEGRFSLVLPEGYQGVDIQVAAHGYAGASLALLKPGAERLRLVVPAGTRVTGRLVHAGLPASGLRLAVVQIERGAGNHFIKAVGAVSDQEGKFAIDHLPADQDYAIFTLVGDGPQKLVITTKRFKAAGNRNERALGDLQVIAAKRLAGRLEVAPGQSLPPDTRIVLGRDPAWDLIAVPVGKDGQFAIDGLPPETYEVRVAAKGFAIAGAGVPYQMLGDQSFGVRLRDSVEDLRIPLAQGQPSRAKQ